MPLFTLAEIVKEYFNSLPISNLTQSIVIGAQFGTKVPCMFNDIQYSFLTHLCLLVLYSISGSCSLIFLNNHQTQSLSKRK